MTNHSQAGHEPELIVADDRSLSMASKESIRLHETIQQSLAEANDVSREIVDSATQAIGNGAGEVTFNDTVTFIVEADGAQKVIFQRNLHLAKD